MLNAMSQHAPTPRHESDATSSYGMWEAPELVGTLPPSPECTASHQSEGSDYRGEHNGSPSGSDHSGSARNCRFRYDPYSASGLRLLCPPVA